MINSFTNHSLEKIFPDEMSVDEALDEIPRLTSSIAEDPKIKIITLYNRIQILKDVSSQLLVELKQCRRSFRDASTAVGELNGNIKKL